MKMRKTHLAILVLCILSLLIMVNGCSRTNQSEYYRSQVGKTEIVEPVNFGNGVYYLATNTNGPIFCNSLSAFIGKHPELKLIAFSGNGTSAGGRDLGYIMYFEPRDTVVAQ